jgi:peptidoglycan hydrolase-like protein with peptidoglycan-binding domain
LKLRWWITVASAQRMLAKLGYYNKKVDGKPWPATRSGLKNFQKDNGLPQTGLINSWVVRALYSRLGVWNMNWFSKSEIKIDDNDRLALARIDAITEIQTDLAQKWFYTWVVDGVDWPKTRRAIIDYNKNNSPKLSINNRALELTEANFVSKARAEDKAKRKAAVAKRRAAARIRSKIV